MAEELALGRRVALKLIHTATGRIPERRLARLRREVEIVARLDHPGLCAVHRADLDADPPWVCMRYVEGETLAQVIGRARRAARTPAATEGDTDWQPGSSATATDLPAGPRDPVSLRRLLAVMEQAARALHAAHEAGVVHRDVKPGNIMVDTEGRAVVLDFGLARQAGGQQASLTRTGEAFGTPAYMSPEQVLGQDSSLDARSDVFSLGATLYEALTLERPHTGLSGRALEQAICERAHAPAARANPSLPSDLTVLLDTALAKEPGRRYASALLLAEDLRRVRLYEPIAARPAHLLVHLRAWMRRNPALATSVGALLLSLSVGLVVTLALLADVRQQADQTASAVRRLELQDLAKAALVVADDHPVDALLLALEVADAEGVPGYHTNNALLAALERCRLERRLQPTREPLPPGTSVSTGRMRISADGRSAVFGQAGLSVFDLATGVEHWRQFGGGDLHSGRFSPDGTRVAAATLSGSVQLFDAQTGAPQRTLAGHVDRVGDLAFSPDGQRCVSAGYDRTLRLWNLSDGRCLALLNGHEGVVTHVIYSADGNTIASLSGIPQESHEPSDRSARLWSRDGQLLATLAGHTDLPTALAFSPDGRLLASAGRDGTARIWSVPDGRLLRVLDHPATVHSVTFSPDGRRLLTTFDPGEIELQPASGAWVFDVDSGLRVLSLEGHGYRAVYCADWSRDGSTIATGSYDHAVRLYDAHTGERQAVLRGGAGMVFDLFLTPDGERVITSVGTGGEVWLPRSRAGVLSCGGHSAPTVDVTLDALGSRLVSASSDGSLRLFDALGGRLLAVLTGHAGPVTAVELMAGDSLIVSGSADGSLRSWQASDGAALGVALLLDSAITLLEPAPGGELLLVGCADGTSLLLNLVHESEPIRLTAHDGPVTCARFTPDGTRVVTGGEDRSLRSWNRATGEPLAVLSSWSENPALRPFSAVFALDLSPDGRLAVAACQDQTIRTWDLDSGELLAQGLVPTPGFLRLVDGGRTAVVGARWNPAVLLVDAMTGRQLHQSQIHHRDRVSALDVQRDGDLVVSGGFDGSVRLWNWRTRQFHARLAAHDGPVHKVRFAADGLSVLSAGQDGRVRMWPVHPVERARSLAPAVLSAQRRREYEQ